MKQDLQVTSRVSPHLCTPFPTQLAHLAACWSAEHVLVLLPRLPRSLRMLSSLNPSQCCSLTLPPSVSSPAQRQIAPVVYLITHPLTHPCPHLTPACSSGARRTSLGVMQVASLTGTAGEGSPPSPCVCHGALTQDQSWLGDDCTHG